MLLAVTSSLAACAMLLSVGMLSLDYHLRYSREYARNLQESCRLAWYLDIHYDTRCLEQGTSSDDSLLSLVFLLGTCVPLGMVALFLLIIEWHRNKERESVDKGLREEEGLGPKNGEGVQQALTRPSHPLLRGEGVKQALICPAHSLVSGEGVKPKLSWFVIAPATKEVRVSIDDVTEDGLSCQQ